MILAKNVIVKHLVLVGMMIRKDKPMTKLEQLECWLLQEIEATKEKEQDLMEEGYKKDDYNCFRLAEQQANYRAALRRTIGELRRIK